MNYILYKTFKPIGILYKNGKILYFDEDSKIDIESLEIYKWDHIKGENNVTDTIIETEEETELRDIILTLQMRNYILDPITPKFMEELHREKDKL